MNTAVLHLMLPTSLPQDLGVRAWLYGAPSPDLEVQLNDLGFGCIGAPDERAGSVAALSEMMASAAGTMNHVHRTATVSARAVVDVVGDLLAHARAYIPDATYAYLDEPIIVGRGTPLERLGDEWVCWAMATVTISR